tara:strand:- start:305 stop:925 length:621 start_codon:yes stop_codon:yes gene_type:complete
LSQRRLLRLELESQSWRRSPPLQQCLAHLAQATIHFLRTRAWEYLARWFVQATTHLLQTRAWGDQDQERQDLPGQHQDQERQDLPAEHLAQAAEHLAQAAEHRVQVEPQHSEHRDRSRGLDLQPEDRVQPAVVAAERALQEHLVGAVPEENLVSQKEQSAKNLNKEMFPAWAAQWCLAAMEQLCCEFVVDPRFRTSQTRLALTPLS